MTNELAPRKTSAPLTRSGNNSRISRLITALRVMAMKRGAAANSETLTLYAELLSKLPTNVVDDVIERLSNEQPGRFESALPNWPTLRSMMNDHNHPLLQLRTIVRKLAKQFAE